MNEIIAEFIEYLTEELKTCKKKINALIDEKNI